MVLAKRALHSGNLWKGTHRIISHSSWEHNFCVLAQKVLPWPFLWPLKQLLLSGEMAELRQKDLYPFLETSILRLNQSSALAHLTFSVPSGLRFRGKKNHWNKANGYIFLMEISEGMRSSWNSSYSWGLYSVCLPFSSSPHRVGVGGVGTSLLSNKSWLHIHADLCIPLSLQLPSDKFFI